MTTTELIETLTGLRHTVADWAVVCRLDRKLTILKSNVGTTREEYWTARILREERAAGTIN